MAADDFGGSFVYLAMSPEPAMLEKESGGGLSELARSVVLPPRPLRC